jgi:hypothetical protein
MKFYSAVVKQSFAELTAAGWEPVGRWGKILRTTTVELRRAPVAFFGHQLIDRDWAESWAVIIASNKMFKPDERRRIIEYVQSDLGLCAAVRAAWALAGDEGVKNLLKEDPRWQLSQ